MIRKILGFLLFLIAATSFSQNFKISATLLDSVSKQPLEAATVFLETAKDSTLLTYTISNKEGTFFLEGNTGVKNVRLNVSFVGYKNYERELDLSKPVQDLGVISVAAAVANLDEVLLKSRAPVTIKKDTLEFNVSSFKTKKNATIEDLLKELPGVEVSDDGKIKVNGKEVSNILVNGKPFFGDDPTIATRNLTKDIIEKIQVVDTKTTTEAFAGEVGDTENKTINLTIKEENNKGVFGRVAAGAGTDKRFEYAGIFNYFNVDTRLSVLAGGNNINSPGFSFGEIQEIFGGGRNGISSMSYNSNGSFAINGRSFGIGEGIVNSRNAGASYADVIKKGVDVSANYFYSGATSNNDSKTQRENILPERRYFTNSLASSKAKSDNHNIDLAFDIKIDSTLLLTIGPSFQVGDFVTRRSNSSESLNENLEQTNSASVFNNGNSQVRNFSNFINATKKFGSKGSFVKFNFKNEFNRTSGEDFLQSQTLVFGENPSEENRNQFTDTDRDFDSYSAEATFRQPLISKKLFLDLKYKYIFDQTNNSETTFNFNETSQDFTDFNLALSTDYDFSNIKKSIGPALTYRIEKFSASFGANFINRKLENKDALRPTLNVIAAYDALEIESFIYGQLSEKASIYSGYNLINQAPTIEQLQPNTDVSDPLNIVTGNPNLKPTNKHSLYFSLNNYDYQNGQGFNSYINLDVQKDAIVNQTIVDENNIRNTTFSNVNGTYRVSLSADKSSKIKLDSLQTLKWSLGFYSNYSKDVNFNNALQYDSKNISLSPNIYVAYNYDKLLELRLRYTFNYSRNSFDDNLFEAREFLRHSVDFNTVLNFPKNVEWRNDIDFNYNPDVTPGFQKSAVFWNSTLAYSFWKENATTTLKVYDLLNQNTNARRSSSQNFIQDSQSTVLEQYFMLSFSWKFNSLGTGGNTGGNDIMQY